MVGFLLLFSGSSLTISFVFSVVVSCSSSLFCFKKYLVLPLSFVIFFGFLRKFFFSS